jgi:uncharacterized membrane protein
VGTAGKYINRFAWELDDQKRAALCFIIGVLVFLLGWRLGRGWESCFLLAWDVAVASYLALLGVVIHSANASMTRGRAAVVDRADLYLLIALVLVTLLGTVGVGAILTAVGHRSTPETRLLVGLSVVAVVCSWLLLHTAFAQHYARLYYDETEETGIWRGGVDFPATPDPTYMDFLYLSFTIGLTYAVSDVNITHAAPRRLALSHSVISFFFYSMALGVVLNAVVTSR